MVAHEPFDKGLHQSDFILQFLDLVALLHRHVVQPLPRRRSCKQIRAGPQESLDALDANSPISWVFHISPNVRMLTPNSCVALLICACVCLHHVTSLCLALAVHFQSLHQQWLGGCAAASPQHEQVTLGFLQRFFSGLSYRAHYWVDDLDRPKKSRGGENNRHLQETKKARRNQMR